jgi:tyrosyl-tRNA synthetase
MFACRNFRSLSSSIVDELTSRQLIVGETNGVREWLASERKVALYAGFDPTARSLHVGSLVLLLTMARFARHGHDVIALLGGATGRIGDPSGRSAERPLLDERNVSENLNGIGRDIQQFWQRAVIDDVRRVSSTRAARHQRSTSDEIVGKIDHDDDHDVGSLQLVDNLQWFGDASVLDFMSNVGRHFRVRALLQKESMRARLDDSGGDGPSFMELAYPLFQAHDFNELRRRYGCRLQLGGSDQWGNITAGCDLVRRVQPGDGNGVEVVHGITIPLLTTASGQKVGKSAGNAPVWLDAELTSDHEFYQYFVRSADDDVERFLRIFTFLPAYRVDAIVAEHRVEPELRLGQRALADEVTRLVRGAAALRSARACASLLYDDGSSGGDDLNALTRADAESIFSDRVECPRAQALESSVVALFLLAAPQTSRSQLNRLAKNGGLYVSKRRVSAATERLEPSTDLLGIDSDLVVLGIGRKRHILLALV